jgi:hypothetical protein
VSNGRSTHTHNKTQQVVKIRTAHQSDLLMDGLAAMRLAHGTILRAIAIDGDRQSVHGNLVRAMEELRLAQRLVSAVERQLEQQSNPACLAASA